MNANVKKPTKVSSGVGCAAVCVSDTEFIHMCLTSVCSPPAGWLCSPDIPHQYSQCLYCLSVIQSDNSIIVDDCLPPQSPQQQGGQCLCLFRFPRMTRFFCLLYVGGTASVTAALSNLQSVPTGNRPVEWEWCKLTCCDVSAYHYRNVIRNSNTQV